MLFYFNNIISISKRTNTSFSNNYKIFLEECCKLPYKKVFIIAGNHEYYDHHTQKVTHQIRSLCKKISNNLIFLHNTIALSDFITTIRTQVGFIIIFTYTTFTKIMCTICLNVYNLFTTY